MEERVARERLAAARLCLLLTRRACRLPPLAVLAAAIDGGCDLVQVREPALAGGALVAWVREVRAVTAARDVPLIVNDRVDAAILGGADGVHVGALDPRPEDLRNTFGPGLLIGFSTHDSADVVAAASRPIDYCGLGPVFDTPTKGLAGRGVALLHEALPHAILPTFAIGGITLANVDRVASAGATRVAVCAAICSATDPASVARALRAAVRTRS